MTETKTLIRPEEIRKSNLFEYYIGEDGIEWQATPMDGQDILWCEENSKDFSKNHRPIKLTPDWLERGGFEYDKDEGGWFYELMPDISTTTCLCIDLHVGINKNLASIVFKEKKTNALHHHMYHVDCEFLHQLQNLYFALTNSELKFKP